MLEQVREILKDYTEVNTETITEKTSFRRDLKLNSLDVVNIVATFEDSFDIEIEDEELAQIVTVGDAIRCIEAKKTA
ncbi:MAG: acyl carrier protein [Lachnospiraceae bacterium]|nr:acyl carrier protein [Lachnospiraceae bacterium]